MNEIDILMQILEAGDERDRRGLSGKRFNNLNDAEGEVIAE